MRRQSMQVKEEKEETKIIDLSWSLAILGNKDGNAMYWMKLVFCSASFASTS